MGRIGCPSTQFPFNWRLEVKSLDADEGGSENCHASQVTENWTKT